jgi:putative acetyltransferase
MRGQRRRGNADGRLHLFLRVQAVPQIAQAAGRPLLRVLLVWERQMPAHANREGLLCVKIETDDLSRPAIRALLNEHLRNMYELSPPESVHALDLEKLRKPGITFWSAWEGPVLVGCGALKEIDPRHGEVKSMRTPATMRRKGAGRAILAHIIEVARSRSYSRLSLETGSMDAFKPAQKLYESFGFTCCGPFGEYREDPNSVFMTLELDSHRAGGQGAPL